MIITFVRSSSYGTHSMCHHRYFLEYVLGVRTPGNKKADLGTITHKALEVLAWKKLCEQRGDSSYEDDSFGHVDIDDITPEWAIAQSFAYYSRMFTSHEWTPADLKLTEKWMNSALSYSRGMYDPRNRNVIAPEQKFDFTLDYPWADYHYKLPDGEVIDGKLGIKGTMDLVTWDSPGIIEIVDWKTGRRLDWATGQEKTYKKLRYDPQLCLYHLAATKLYPDADEIFITIYFINDGGPFTLCFDRSDLEYTERLIERKFREIKDDMRPRKNVSWRCKKFCYFGMNSHPEDPTKNYCDFIHDKIRKDGIDLVTHQHGNDKAYLKYGDGGGRKAQDDK